MSVEVPSEVSRRDRLLRLFDTAFYAMPGFGRDVPAEFEARRYAIVRALLPGALCRTLYRYAKARAESGAMKADATVPGAPPSQAYDPMMEELLHRMTPWAERLTGLPLHPTYAFFRVYGPGDALQKHRDRRQCEISLTINLGYAARAAWPIHLQGAGDPVAVGLEPGDAVLYRGIELTHWREPFDGDHCAQVFLHYVTQHGPHAQCRYNGRAGLNRLAGAE